MAAVVVFWRHRRANEKPPVVQEVIHATPEKIKKGGLAMIVPKTTQRRLLHGLAV